MPDLDEIQLEAEDAMDKAVDYLKGELRGIRTGRASTGLVEYVKVDYYGAPTELRQLAIISVPEPTQLLIKPFDASAVQAIAKGLEQAGLGLNPQVEGKQIRLVLPALSGDRRKQLINSVKDMAEQAKVAIRNARRDANKQIDKTAKAESLPEDDVDSTKEEVQEATKKHEAKVDELVEAKIAEIQEV